MGHSWEIIWPYILILQSKVLGPTKVGGSDQFQSYLGAMAGLRFLECTEIAGQYNEVLKSICAHVLMYRLEHIIILTLVGFCIFT